MTFQQLVFLKVPQLSLDGEDTPSREQSKRQPPYSFAGNPKLRTQTLDSTTSKKDKNFKNLRFLIFLTLLLPEFISAMFFPVHSFGPPLAMLAMPRSRAAARCQGPRARRHWEALHRASWQQCRSTASAWRRRLGNCWSKRKAKVQDTSWRCRQRFFLFIES